MVKANNIQDILYGRSGVRAQAMGGAFVSVVSDPAAAYWNPASLGYLSGSHANIGYTSLYQEIDRFNLDFTYGFGEKNNFWLDNASIGINIFREGVSDIPHTIANELGGGSIIGHYEDTKTVLNISYAKVFRERFIIGFNLKEFIHEHYKYRANGFGVDVGSIFILRPEWTIGVTVRNLIQPEMKWNTDSDHSDIVNTDIICGMSYKLDLYKRDKLLLSFDYLLNDNQFNVGLEYSFMDLLAFRAGYNELNKMTYGVGIDVYGLKLNYVYYNHEEMGAVQSITLGF